MAMLVVWSHSFAFWGSEDREPLSILMNGTYNAGNVGVLVFFTISGFLISHSYLHSENVLQFLRRRVCRIYPGYIAATLIGAFVIIPLFSSRAVTFSQLEVLKVIGMNLLLRNYIPPTDAFGGSAINGSLWSIPYEFWCYIGVAALGMTSLLPKRFFCLAITILTMAVRVWLDLTGQKPGGGLIGLIVGWPYLWFVVLPCFMFGVSAYLYRAAVPRSRILLIEVVTLLVLVANLPIQPLYRLALTNLVFPPTIAYVVFYAAFSGHFRLHGAARWGDFSYGTYLYALPLQNILFATVGMTMGFPLYIVASMALALIGGITSWYLVERWFLLHRRNVNAPRESIAPKIQSFDGDDIGRTIVS